jgi:hypothetical protein
MDKIDEITFQLCGAMKEITRNFQPLSTWVVRQFIHCPFEKKESMAMMQPRHA